MEHDYSFHLQHQTEFGKIPSVFRAIALTNFLCTDIQTIQ